MKKIIIIISSILVLFVLIVGITFLSYFQIVNVPTSSMANTINKNDRLLNIKVVKDIKRGDMVVFKYPLDPTTQYVRRVIGLPGETVQIKDHHVLINNQELPEHIMLTAPGLSNGQPDLDAPLRIMRPANNVTGTKYQVYLDEEAAASFDVAQLKMQGQNYAVGEAFVIPADSYFLLSDNRSNGLDSRFYGPISKSSIVAKTMMIYSSAKGEWISVE